MKSHFSKTIFSFPFLKISGALTDKNNLSGQIAAVNNAFFSVRCCFETSAARF